MAMKLQEAKEFVLSQEPIFLQRARNINGRHSYVCPCCQNGSGANGTGISASPYSKRNHLYFKCFKCGEGGDIIDLAMKHIGYTNWMETMKWLCDQYGVELEGYRSTHRRDIVIHELPSVPELQEPPKVSQKAYFEKVEADLDPSYLEGRGLSVQTQKHYHIGTDKAWVNPVVAERYGGNVPSYLKSPRCIIPTSEFSYLARDIRSDLDETNKKYQKVKFGKVRLFNKEEAMKQDVFVVTEGEIDAMSVYEASDGGVEGLGLGSTANWRILAAELAAAEQKPSLVILALDNDEAGQKATLQLSGELEKMGIAYEVLKYNGKDPNEALMNDGDNFSDAICQLAKEAEMGVEIG